MLGKMWLNGTISVMDEIQPVIKSVVICSLIQTGAKMQSKVRKMGFLLGKVYLEA